MTMVGVEWLVDAHGCSPEALRDADAVKRLLERVILELDLRVVGPCSFHAFNAQDGSPAGVTALYLLQESHLTCHTYPELGVATFNLYCCKSRREWPWQTELGAALGSTRVRVEKRFRGQSP
jgi:S-adenosylmethionine decarboxylase